MRDTSVIDVFPVGMDSADVGIFEFSVLDQVLVVVEVFRDQLDVVDVETFVVTGSGTVEVEHVVSGFEVDPFGEGVDKVVSGVDGSDDDVVPGDDS